MPVNNCKNEFVIDLTKGLLQTTSDAIEGGSPLILDMQNIEEIPSTGLPFTPTCDPPEFATYLTFNRDYTCAAGSVIGTIGVNLSVSTPIVDNSIFTLSFGGITDVQVISFNSNIVVDDINVNEFRVVDASLLTLPITLTIRFPNDGCRAISITGVVDSITPLLDDWEIGLNQGDTLNFIP